jgi:hypothetical protein
MDCAAGVYGLNVTGLGDVSRYTDPAFPNGPTLAVRQQLGEAPPDAESRLFDDRAIIPLIENGLLEVSREPAVASFTMPRLLSSDELLHPWLVPAAATVSAWHGRRVLHGGLVSNGKAAVAVVGDKEGGKSTLLASLAFDAGLAVMCDDLVVFDDRVVFAGPRCIDLRPGSVTHLPEVVGSSLVRDGTRLRVPLPKTASTAELLGVVVLEWSEQTGTRAVPPSERLPHILPHALVEGIPAGAAGVLGFAQYRMWRLTRPREWGALATSAKLIRELLDA